MSWFQWATFGLSLFSLGASLYSWRLASRFHKQAQENLRLAKQRLEELRRWG